jgi:hypothetical protein
MKAKKPVFIEPLLQKLEIVIKHGDQNPLSKALTMFGTTDDLDSLTKAIESCEELEAWPLVDFMPFTSMGLGSQSRIQRLGSLFHRRPFFIVARQGMALEQLAILKEIATIICDDQYRIVRVTYPNEEVSSSYGKLFPEGTDMFQVHNDWVHTILNKNLASCIRKPPDGRRYVKLHDETWANMWIDVKTMIQDPLFALFVAYQMGYMLTHGYRDQLSEDAFVVANNTSYVIAIFLNKIFDEKELVIVDRLGVYPSLTKTKIVALQGMQGKRLCMIEDVVSTGREADLVYLLSFLQGGSVGRVICLFNLEVASPLLLEGDRLISLCRPSVNLKYKRVAKYAGKERQA